MWRRFAAAPDVFEDVLASGNVQLSGDRLPLYGQFVTGNYFAALGIRPFVGRLLEEADAVRSGERAVAVLSHDAWTARFGADPNIVGRSIRLGRLQFTVVGVAQPRFTGFSDAPIGFWVPVTMAVALPVRDPYGADRPPVLTVLGRTRAGVHETQAATWFDLWARQRFAGAAADDRVTLSRVESRATRIPLNGRTLSLFLAIEAAFAMVLLMACANVGNLMLARGITRQREIAVRLSVGASRARIIRQLSIESLLLAVPAGAVGYALALVTARVIPPLWCARGPRDCRPLPDCWCRSIPISALPASSSSARSSRLPCSGWHRRCRRAERVYRGPHAASSAQASPSRACAACSSWRRSRCARRFW